MLSTTPCKCLQSVIPVPSVMYYQIVPTSSALIEELHGCHTGCCHVNSFPNKVCTGERMQKVTCILLFWMATARLRMVLSRERSFRWLRSSCTSAFPRPCTGATKLSEKDPHH